MDHVLVLVAGLFAGTLGGIVGTGSSLVHDADPGRDVRAAAGGPDHGDGRDHGQPRTGASRGASRSTGAPVAAYCATAVPGAILGARLLLAIPPSWAETALGVFFLSLIPARRWLARRAVQASRARTCCSWARRWVFSPAWSCRPDR